MDLTSRYRTRLPPREHRETVKMLMRSLGATDVGGESTTTTQNRRFIDTTGRGATRLSPQRNPTQANYRVGPAMVSEVDRNSSMNRRLVSSRKQALSELTSSNELEYESQQEAEQLTSTSNGASSNGPQMYQDDVDVEEVGGKENVCSGESIPSRTIAIQCELKTSSTLGKRPDNSMQASSISSTRYGFYNYSAETLAQRRKLQRTISNWNIADEQPSGSSEDDQSDVEVKRATTNLKSLESNDELEEEEEEDSECLPRPRASVSVERSIARNRVHSLSRRPTTALSYVSDLRLKDADDERRSHSSQTMRHQSRAMSHMNLSRPRTPVNKLESSSPSCSDCDQRSRTNSSRSRKSSSSATTRAASRPTLISSSRNEHVRGYKTLERLPVSRSNPVEQDTQVFDYRSKRRQALDSSSIEDERQHKTMGQVLRRLDNNTEALAGRQYRSNLVEGQERINSMSLNRRPKPVKVADSHRYNSDNLTSGYCTAKRVSRRASTLTNNRQPQHRFNGAQDYLSPGTGAWSSSGASNNQPVEPTAATDRYDSGLYDSASSGNQSGLQAHRQPEPVQRRRGRHLNSTELVDEFDYEIRKSRQLNGANEDTEDSDCSVSKTWANPSSRPSLSSARRQVHEEEEEPLRAPRYKRADLVASRSHSMRDISAETDRNYMQECCIDYYKKQRPTAMRHQQQQVNQQQDNNNHHHHHLRRDYESSPESSLLNGDLQRDYLKSRAVNYDSQYRLNEIGLPEVDRQSPINYASPAAPATTRGGSSSSHLGLNNARVYQSGRQLERQAIAGRALSQQQLIRPSMPGSRRRRAGYSAANSLSDAGGSSISLAGNRLAGSRHELAYTRTPVVMYIPQVGSSELGGRSGPSASSGLEDDMMSTGRGSRLRRTLRSRQMSRVGGSQDISLGSRGRSVSRNGSESESSSMLRTLIRGKPSKSLAQHHQNKQPKLVMSRHLQQQQQPMDEQDHEDHIGQLASEMDSAKFRRRYSVPRNAKINWFSKLKQRVSSSVKP